MGIDVALEIDSRRQLGDLDPAFARPKDGALGHIEHALATLAAVAGVVGDLLHGLDQLGMATLGQDPTDAAGPVEAEAAGGEGPAEDHLLGILADIDEAAE